jgi:hypothetical protein
LKNRVSVSPSHQEFGQQKLGFSIQLHNRGWGSPDKRPGRADNSYHTDICDGRVDFVRPRPAPGGVCPMTFHSILFEKTEDGIKKETLEAPVFFVDLYLDQIIDAITAGKQEYSLKPFFYTSLNDIDVIKYRHEVMRDLENEILFEHIKSFAQKMRAMREHLAQADKLYYKYQKEKWFLDAVEIYCDAVNCLVHDLSLADLKSRGFLALGVAAKADRHFDLVAADFPRIAVA